MNIHNLQLSTGQTVLLLDHFFNKEILEKIYEIFKDFYVGNHNWELDPPNDPKHVRYRYNAGNPLVQEIETYLSSPEILIPLSQALGKELKFFMLKFWVDTKMLLHPHMEKPMGKVTLAQIYIADNVNPYLGTVINQDNKQMLFQLPYRNNFGWLFDKAETVMHSKITETPDGFNRQSLSISFTYD